MPRRWTVGARQTLTSGLPEGKEARKGLQGPCWPGFSFPRNGGRTGRAPSRCLIIRPRKSNRRGHETTLVVNKLRGRTSSSGGPVRRAAGLRRSSARRCSKGHFDHGPTGSLSPKIWAFDKGLRTSPGRMRHRQRSTRSTKGRTTRIVGRLGQEEKTTKARTLRRSRRKVEATTSDYGQKTKIQKTSGEAPRCGRGIIGFGGATMGRGEEGGQGFRRR